METRQTVFRAALTISLLFSTHLSFATTLSTELLSEYLDDERADDLNSYGPMIFSPNGQHLYIGNYSGGQRVVRFRTDANGTLLYDATQNLTTNNSATTASRFLAINAAGDRIYTAGPHNISVLARNQTSGNLSQLTELLVNPNLEITDLQLSLDGQHLYVVSNDYSFATDSGSSTLHTYLVSNDGSSIELINRLSEPASNRPLTSITLAREDETVFIGRRDSTEVLRRDPISGSLTSVRRNPGVWNGSVSRDGGWMFSAMRGELTIYRVNKDTGELTQTQQFRANQPPLTGSALRGAATVRLSLDEQRMVVSGYAQIGVIAGGIRAATSTDVFTRDTPNGEWRREGKGVRSGSALSRHPTNDWFYSFIPSTTQTGGISPTTPVISQQGLLPSLPLTRIVAAVLPSSRAQSNRDSNPERVTAFATVLNPGTEDAIDCTAGILRDSTSGLFFSVRETDPASNQPLESAGEYFNVPAGGATQLIMTLGADIAFGDAQIPELLDVRFFCANSMITERVEGVTTFAFASDTGPIPDLLTATASPDRPGVVSLPDVNGSSFFTVATLNLGGGALIRARPALELAGAVAGAQGLLQPPAVELLICETDLQTSQCKAPFASEVERRIEPNEIATYTVVVNGTGEKVRFFPEQNRAFILMQDVDGNLRGGSSVALETQ